MFSLQLEKDLVIGELTTRMRGHRPPSTTRAGFNKNRRGKYFTIEPQEELFFILNRYTSKNILSGQWNVEIHSHGIFLTREKVQYRPVHLLVSRKEYGLYIRRVGCCLIFFFPRR